MFFLRVYEKFVILVEMIFQVFYDVVSFSSIFVAHIVFFAILNILSGSGISKSDYPGVNNVVAYFL